MSSRLRYVVLSSIIFLVEIIIALFLNDTIIRPYIGDILVVVLIFCITRVFMHRELKLLPLYIFIFAVFVEVLQFFDIASLIHAGNVLVAKTVIGSTFDWIDILCYGIGSLAVICIQWIESINAKLLLPICIASIFISASAFISLAYNGLWWPVSPEAMGYSIRGIDVARYQGDIDWKAISEQNITFAYIKATEGSSYKDPYFDKNIVESKDNGIINGAYHFFSPESSGKTQAANFINAVYQYDTDMPPVVDFEVGGFEKEKILYELNVFIEEIRNCFGINPIIYTTQESYNFYLSKNYDDYDFWFRDLFKKPSLEGNLILWQYCNRGRLAGIDKNQKYVDLNVFIGNKREFIEFSGMN